MLCVTVQKYSLTFRCINCGRNEASATYSSDTAVAEEQVKVRIYRVSCTACGWKGEACGFSAIRVTQADKP